MPDKGSTMAAETGGAIGFLPSEQPLWAFRRYFLLFLAGAVFFIAFDLADGTLHNGDPDDLLRALQVRSFLVSGSWYDATIPGIRGPEPYVTPWSRLVDLPYALIASLLAPLTGLDHALQLSFRIWPALMGIAYCWLVLAILRRIASSRAALPPSVLLAIVILMTFPIWEFAPGRIDHHNVQMVLLLCTAYGVSRFDFAGGIVAGTATAASLAIGLEMLPVLAACLVFVTAAWILDMRGSRAMWLGTGLATAIATPALMVLLIAPADYAVARTDAFSAPFVMALTGFGVIATALALAFGEGRHPLARATAAGVAGLALIAAIALLFPALLDGPFAMFDPLTRAYWFDRIPQERNALVFFEFGRYREILILLAMTLIVGFSARHAAREAWAGRPAVPALVVLAGAALLMAFGSSRFLRFTAVVVPLLLPLAIDGYRSVVLSSRYRMIFSVAVVAVPLITVSLIQLAVPIRQRPHDAYDFLLMDDCTGQDLGALGTLGAARIMTPPALGLRILALGDKRITVSSIPFHRSAPAISRLLRVFMAKTGAERAALTKDFDYLALCRPPADLPAMKDLPLLDALASGRHVPGLEAVPTPASPGLILLRIGGQDTYN